MKEVPLKMAQPRTMNKLSYPPPGPASMDSLVRGIPFSQDGKMHGCTFIIARKEHKGIYLLAAFTYFCRFSKGPFCIKSPISTGRNG